MVSWCYQTFSTRFLAVENVICISYVVLRFWCHYLCASRVFCTFRENHFSHHLHWKFHLSTSSCWAHRSTIFKSNFPPEKHSERFYIRVTIHCDPFFAFMVGFCHSTFVFLHYVTNCISVIFAFFALKTSTSSSFFCYFFDAHNVLLAISFHYSASK